ncbi:MAG TPA: 2-isopropylmalate synthase [Chloroflexota bacterium]|jgi:2-isopropylmalate synthase|nr:2-isopropylmalate synthase [Chloroflexota bacterium]
MEQVRIFDTTLRDGEQSPGATLNVDEKLEIALQLERLGVDVIEAGFPITSEGDFRAVSLIAKKVKNATVAGLARGVPADIDRCYEAVKGAQSPRIHVFISSSDIHLAHQMRKSRQEVLEMTRAMVGRAAKYLPDVEFSPMDASRSDRDYLYEMLSIAVEAGATTLNIPDTVGYAWPDEYADLIRGIFEHVRGIGKAVISVHCHDDLGLAVANSLAAVKAGARQIECTINGIGERAGNTSLEEVVMAIKTRPEVFGGLTTRIDTTQIYRTSRLVSARTGMVVQPNKAIVGANAFAHMSGIHQDGVLKERTTFEILDPKDVGLGESAIVLGKLSGRHGFKQRLEELGYHLDPEDLNRAFLRFKKLADKKRDITDRDLEALVSDEMRVIEEAYRLEHVQVICGDHTVPTATVKMITPDGSVVVETATGTGPVDASYKAVDKVIGVGVHLSEYVVQAVTSGIDAQAEVTVRIQQEGRIYSGNAASTDVVVASARAYVHALNRLTAHRTDVGAEYARTQASV